MDSRKLNEILEKMAAEEGYDQRVVDITKIKDHEEKQAVVDSYMNQNLSPNRKGYRKPIFKE